MKDNLIKVDLVDQVLCIKINRPEKKNALTLEMYSDLSKSLDNAEQESTVRAVLIQGSEGMFTSGNDIADFLEQKLTNESPVLQFLHKLAAFPKPLIAAVDGCAVGIGTTMLLHCDYVIASDSAFFQMPFVNLGLCPEGASSLLLPAAIGYQRAAYFLLLGKKFTPETAKEMGLIAEVVSQEKLIEIAIERSKEFCELAPQAMIESKRLIKAQFAKHTHEVIDSEAEVFAKRLISEEAKEAFSAFLEKRPPKF